MANIQPGCDDATAQATRPVVGVSWDLLPIWHTVNGRCGCGRVDCPSPGKHPRTAHGLLDASHDPAQLARWARQYPDCNWAARTGQSFDAVDIDPDHGGDDSLAGIAKGRQLGWGPVCATGGGGRHYYCAPSGGGNRASVLPGIDYRGVGGFVVIPDSNHVSGNRYRWLVGLSVPLRPLPTWLADIFLPPKNSAQVSLVCRSRVPGRTHRYAQAALEAEAEAVAGTPEGGRNDRLNRAAFSAGQLIAAGWLDVADAIETLTDAAIASGLGEREAVATIDSGLRAGIAHPRGAR